MKKLINKKGFTLIELMVVISVIAVLTTMVLFGLSAAQASARDAQRQQIMTSIQVALERYYSDNQKYTTGGFCDMLAVIKPLENLSAPLDPVTKVDVCDQQDSSHNAIVAGTTIKYSYSSDPSIQTYVLTLVKESGGQNTYPSPQ